MKRWKQLILLVTLSASPVFALLAACQGNGAGPASAGGRSGGIARSHCAAGRCGVAAQLL
jgi:hypothetical protein